MALSRTITAFAESSCVAREILPICDGRSGELPSITVGVTGVTGVVGEVGEIPEDGVDGVDGVGLDAVKLPDGVEVI